MYLLRLYLCLEAGPAVIPDFESSILSALYESTILHRTFSVAQTGLGLTALRWKIFVSNRGALRLGDS